MDSTFVLSFRRAGSNQPALRPSGTRIVNFKHDGDGGTHTLYKFPDADVAANFADLVKGQTFTNEVTATGAYLKATNDA